ncbi:MAG: hypothetical protein N2490_07750 [Ignavibacteria bacterium]|nr:hypothetical protein [Ignavibacteria bacterium]
MLVISIFFIFSIDLGYSQDDNIVPPITARFNIEGVWNAEPMGGKYYIRQIGNEVFWFRGR